MYTEKCLCAQIFKATTGREQGKILIHLSGCPEDYQTKEYDALPWYKKLTAYNPRKIYRIHIKETLRP